MLKVQLFWKRFYATIQPAMWVGVMFFFFGATGYSQDRELDIGLRFQKSINLYYENGITLQYTDERLLSQRLFIGLSYVSSRFGTAMGTNAIKQDNFFISGTYMFRPERLLQPFIRLNTGYFTANYEDPVFDVLPQNSVLISPETGLSYRFGFPLKIGVSLGYNLITGDGRDGPGTLYPLFIQTSITWNILSKTQAYDTNL